MASITSLSNSSYNTSSIYGNRNVISGLASGMDTETMIENAVSGIKLKIQNLVKKRTKVEWQQEAYRSIIDKAVNFNQKYTSYSSKTNLLSNSFFSNAVNTVTRGTYADKITATGKSSSDIKINAVKQMATAASYTVSGLAGQSAGGIASAVGGKEFDIAANMTVNNVSGSLTFQYGGTNGTTFDISFDELEDLDQMEGNTNAEKLANAINNKLKDVTYTYRKNGVQEVTTADKAIKVTASSDGSIRFSDGLGNGNKVTISSSSGKIKNAFGLGNEDGGDTSIKVGSTSLANHNMPTHLYLNDKSLSVSLNGVSKSISIGDVISKAGFSDSDDADAKNLKFQNALQDELNDKFGYDTDGTPKVTVARGTDGKLSFTPSGKGSTLTLSGTAVKAMGFEYGDSNYINTSKKLKDLAGDFFTKENRLKPVGSVNASRMIDSAGNKVALHEDGSYYRVNADGQFMYDFKVNGTNINVTENTTLEGLMSAINSNADAGVKVTYSKLTNEFKFTATETGSNGKIEFGGMAKDLFAPSQTKAVGEKTFADAFGMDFGTDSTRTISLKVPGGADMSLSINATDTVQDVLDKINDPSTFFSFDGNRISIDDRTGEFVVTDKNGKKLDFTFAEGALGDNGPELKVPTNPNVSYTSGQDAIMDVEINGVRFTDLTRSSNSFDLDGLTVNVKGTFNENVTMDDKGVMTDKDGNTIDPVTFETSTDSDKIIDAIRDFVNDYNEMVTEIKNAYTTTPATKSDKSRYEPLTAEEEEKYSESELAAYNEKAKQGILFGDTTLSSMYNKLLNAIQPGGSDGQILREIGIGTSYNSGLTTISLDEDKLRTALESDPDKVKNAFTKTREGGSSTDGLMQTMQNTLNTYTKTTGEPKGVLIQRAGSVKSPTSLNSNSLKSQIDRLDSQIERWQNKMSDQIDRYTTQFSRLEQLIAEMNSQASAFAGLMGGSTGGY